MNTVVYYSRRLTHSVSKKKDKSGSKDISEEYRCLCLNEAKEVLFVRVVFALLLSVYVCSFCSFLTGSGVHFASAVPLKIKAPHIILSSACNVSNISLTFSCIFIQYCNNLISL